MGRCYRCNCGGGSSRCGGLPEYLTASIYNTISGDTTGFLMRHNGLTPGQWSGTSGGYSIGMSCPTGGTVNVTLAAPGGVNCTSFNPCITTPFDPARLKRIDIVSVSLSPLEVEIETPCCGIYRLQISITE